MLGLVLLGGLGVIELRALADGAASPTFLWPMIAGGLLLGVGFIVSGYCPGTSVVAAGSGNVDGIVTVLGVVAGTFVHAELMRVPAFAHFNGGSNLGNVYLYELLKLPPAVVALLVAVMAVGCFVGAEKVERIFTRKRTGAAPIAQPRRLAFATIGALTALALLTLAVPQRSRAAAVRAAAPVTPEALAHRVLEAPWTVRILDLRAEAACVAKRVPGAECVPAAALEKLGLRDDPGVRDLVLVGDADLPAVPAAAAGYPGRVLVLAGGFAGWTAFALTKPAAPPSQASAAERAAASFRATVYAAMTGIKQAPPPPPAAVAGAPRKKGGGGCSQ
jgi:hypothetical protein